MTEEQISICKEILKKFIYRIRTSSACEIVFHYYTDSLIKEKGLETYPMGTSEYFRSFNYDRLKKQIKKKILSSRNFYWNLDEKKIKIVENLCDTEEFDKYFKEYVDNLWSYSLKEQEEEFEKEKRELKEKDDIKLKAILKDKYDICKEVVTLILDDTREYPCKSDKIKVLLELGFDVDTITLILATKEKWVSQRGYVNKYYEERKELIKQRKIVEYDLDSTIKYILGKLKNNI